MGRLLEFHSERVTILKLGVLLGQSLLCSLLCVTLKGNNVQCMSNVDFANCLVGLASAGMWADFGCDRMQSKSGFGTWLYIHELIFSFHILTETYIEDGSTYTWLLAD